MEKHVVETYRLDGTQLPAMPVPHDCVIRRIGVEGRMLTFDFEEDISRHDAIRHFRPEAKSLILRFHLADPDFCLYAWHRPVRFFFPQGYYKAMPSAKIAEIPKGGLEYLYHNVGYRSLIIRMDAYLLELEADFVEYEWVL